MKEVMTKQLQERYLSYWACENKTPIFTARICDGSYKANRTREWWMSVDEQLKKTNGRWNISIISVMLIR